MIRRELLMATAVITSLVTTACSDTTAPSQAAPDGLSSASSRKSGALHLTKECSAYLGRAGDHCTVIESNLKQIPVDSRVVYLVAANLERGTYDGNVELRVNRGNVGFGHCTVTDLFATIAHTIIGHCSFSGGTGRFKEFHAQIVVSVGSNPIWADWDGSYSLSHRN